jgi:dTDP-4-dehydrorhamnose 3,5-epimerase
MRGVDYEETTLPGCLILCPAVRSDSRGSFVKPFQASTFQALGLETGFTEQYWSVSIRGVVRGLHFQAPPSEHGKLVYCTEGEVFDVVVDLRRGTPTFGHHTTVPLSGENGRSLYVPRGCAHGFAVITGRATMIYNVTSEYDPGKDTGIRWDSVGIKWPVFDPIVSERDLSLPGFHDFNSPF